jgi:hypothetical protein
MALFFDFWAGAQSTFFLWGFVEQTRKNMIVKSLHFFTFFTFQDPKTVGILHL